MTEVIQPAPDLTVLRHDVPRGGGLARNRGLVEVTADHVIFVDADDLVLPPLRDLLADLAGAGSFDICQFRYADSRVAEEGLWGHPDWDERFWDSAGQVVGALRDLPGPLWPVLAQTANYPWNKVYDTAFLRRHGIGCAATAVHQDIPLHWMSYLEASRVLVSDRVCAWHEVRERGGRLTNRAGAERMEVFDALDPVALRIARAGRPDWEAALAEFTLGLIDWGAWKIAPELEDELRAAETRWLNVRVGPWIGRIAAADPGLAARCVRGWDERAAWPVLAHAWGGAGLRRGGACLRGRSAPGDHAVLVDLEGLDDTPARQARFFALFGFAEGVGVTRVLGTGGACWEEAADLALQSLCSDPDPPDQVLFAGPGVAPDRDALGRARDRMAEEGRDLLRLCWTDAAPPGPNNLFSCLFRHDLLNDLRPEGDGLPRVLWALCAGAQRPADHEEPVGAQGPDLAPARVSRPRLRISSRQSPRRRLGGPQSRRLGARQRPGRAQRVGRGLASAGSSDPRTGRSPTPIPVIWAPVSLPGAGPSRAGAAPIRIFRAGRHAIARPLPTMRSRRCGRAGPRYRTALRGPIWWSLPIPAIRCHWARRRPRRCGPGRGRRSFRKNPSGTACFPPTRSRPT